MDEYSDDNNKIDLVITDKLTNIKSLQQTHQEFLNNERIYTFQQLGKLSVNSILSILKKNNVLIPKEIVAYWISSANRLVKKSQNDQTQLKRPTSSWEEITSFYISFQRSSSQPDEHLSKPSLKTYIDHLDSNNSKSWEGFELDPLCQWIDYQLQEKLASPDNSEHTNSNHGQIQYALETCQISIYDNEENIVKIIQNNQLIGTIGHSSPLQIQLKIVPTLPSPSFPPLHLSVYKKLKHSNRWEKIIINTSITFSIEETITKFNISKGIDRGEYNLLFVFIDRNNGETTLCRELENLTVI